MGEVNMLWPDIKTQIDDPFLVMYCYYLYHINMFGGGKHTQLIFCLHFIKIEKNNCTVHWNFEYIP